MYSFEGDFRRKPQQNLAGASQNMTREALLQKAQQERMKREEHRKKLTNITKIQACVRSFLSRIRSKHVERQHFDAGLTEKNLTEDLQLALLIRRLLFFYDEHKDSSRLILISQQLLKQWTKVLKNEGSFLQIRRLLALHLKLLNCGDPQSRDSLAIPLRMLEVFTCVETAKKVMDANRANIMTSRTLLYLVKRGFFKELRALLESRTPPLYSPSPNPPTPLAGSLFDILQRPFPFVQLLDSQEYSTLVLLEFASSILCRDASEVVRLFLLPALRYKTCGEFPYAALVACLSSTTHTGIHYSSWLLYSLLLLQPDHFVQKVCGTQAGGPSLLSQPTMLSYLSLMSRLTSNLCLKATRDPAGSRHTYQAAMFDGDSDSDTEESLTSQRETAIHSHCIDMLNDDNSCVLYVCMQAGPNDWNEQALEHISGICHHLLLSHKMAVHKYKLLYTLAFKPLFLRALWSWLSGLQLLGGCGGRPGSLLASLSQGLRERCLPLLSPLTTFCCLYSLLVATLHDEEFGGNQAAAMTSESSTCTYTSHTFTFPELGQLCVTLRQACLALIDLAFSELRINVGEDYRSVVSRALPQQERSQEGDNSLQNQTAVWCHLFKVSVRLLRQLHTKDQRLHFTRGEHAWCGSGAPVLPLLTERPHDLLAPRLYPRLRHYRPFAAITNLTREECEEGPPLTTKEIRAMTILKEIPFVVPFSQRAMIFQGLISRDKHEHQTDLVSFLQGPIINIVIRRSHLYEDAFEKLSPQNEPNIRLKMRIQLMNLSGLEEAGVDGGGVFREFLSELLRTACDPNRGFFRLTKDNMLYPNPAVRLLVDSFRQHYFFIGRMLGKALYESVLIDIPLAEFFLQAIAGEEGGGGEEAAVSGGEADIHRLVALDETLHRSLLQLRAMPAAAVADLGLDFTVMSDELGEQRVEELKPGGANIAVTAENRIEYIHLVAEWKLSRQTRTQVAAVRRGLADVLPLAWLRIFSGRELRLLVSGSETEVDVDDLKRHTMYTGGYAVNHPTIKYFWKVVENFTDEQKRQLLKFVTSCSRPPLFGFKNLEPQFSIQRAGTSERLPTASTCLNLLKLPEFPSETVLQEKLLYAINASAGFELS